MRVGVKDPEEENAKMERERRSLFELQVIIDSSPPRRRTPRYANYLSVDAAARRRWSEDDHIMVEVMERWKEGEETEGKRRRYRIGDDDEERGTEERQLSSVR